MHILNHGNIFIRSQDPVYPNRFVDDRTYHRFVDVECFGIIHERVKVQLMVIGGNNYKSNDLFLFLIVLNSLFVKQLIPVCCVINFKFYVATSFGLRYRKRNCTQYLYVLLWVNSQNRQELARIVN